MELNKYIEHTLLKQDATKADFEKLFKEARDNKFFGVCVNPAYVEMAREALNGTDVKIVTVVGFPLGANKTEIKAAETVAALKDGADEIDMVLNVTELKNKNYDYVSDEVAALKKVCGEHNLKVMYETVAPHGLRVKASGGIKTKESAIALVQAGASRLGTSSGVAIVS